MDTTRSALDRHGMGGYSSFQSIIDQKLEKQTEASFMR